MGSCLVKPHWEARSLPRAVLSPIFTWVRRLRMEGQEEIETHLEKVLQLLPPSATEKARLEQVKLVRRRRKKGGKVIVAKVWRSISTARKPARLYLSPLSYSLDQ